MIHLHKVREVVLAEGPQQGLQVGVLERCLQLDSLHPFVVITCRMVDLEEAIFNAVLGDLETNPVTEGPMGAALDKGKEVL